MEGSEAAAAHPSGIIPTLQNIVATVNLGCKLELKKIAMGARNAEYNPKRFAAVIMRIREPKTTALIFASGKMVRLHGMCRKAAAIPHSAVHAQTCAPAPQSPSLLGRCVREQRARRTQNLQLGRRAAL